MSDELSGAGLTAHAAAADLEATRTVTRGRPPAGRTAEPPADAVTEMVIPRAATEVVRHGPGLPAPDPGHTAQASRQARPGALPPGIVRYGPGVPAVPPAGRAELTAAHVWHDTRPAGLSRRLVRLRQLSGLALTVILLAASGVLLYLRFHHTPFRVTGVALTQAANGCGAVVTGQVTTNGAGGTVSYQWLFAPSSQLPQPLRQSVAAGQRTVEVTVDLQGQGEGSSSQRVTLQVLDPGQVTASATVTVRCL
jgi:hypothetical protein